MRELEETIIEVDLQIEATQRELVAVLLVMNASGRDLTKEDSKELIREFFLICIHAGLVKALEFLGDEEVSR
jgi:hypothetical protein